MSETFHAEPLPSRPEPLRAMFMYTTWKYELPDLLERLGLPGDLKVNSMHYENGTLYVNFRKSAEVSGKSLAALVEWLREDGEPGEAE